MLEVEIESKTKEEAIRKAQEALNANVNEFIYHITEIKGKLFKGTTYKIKAVTLTKISDIVKEYLEKIIQTLGVHSTIDIQIMDRKY